MSERIKYKILVSRYNSEKKHFERDIVITVQGKNYKELKENQFKLLGKLNKK